MIDLWSLMVAVILGLVEGATEFLPVSSTGHLIVVSALLGFRGDRANTFGIFIQVGAVLAVLWHYRTTLFLMAKNAFRPGPDQRLALNVLLAFLPAAMIGLVLIEVITTYLFNPLVVAVALILGGVVILLLEWRVPRTTTATLAEVSPRQAIWIGLAQCVAMIPGTSRAATTILGGFSVGLSRPAATEFSFLLAIPTIFGAAALDLWQSRDLIGRNDVPMFTIGVLVAFGSALVVIRGFLRYVERHSFAGFAWYRIGFGALLLGLIGLGVL